MVQQHSASLKKLIRKLLLGDEHHHHHKEVAVKEHHQYTEVKAKLFEYSYVLLLQTELMRMD